MQSELHWMGALVKRLCVGLGCRRAPCFLLLIVSVQQEEEEAPVP